MKSDDNAWRTIICIYVSYAAIENIQKFSNIKLDTIQHIRSKAYMNTPLITVAVTA